jgi:hypothetical protein
MPNSAQEQVLRRNTIRQLLLRAPVVTLYRSNGPELISNIGSDVTVLVASTSPDGTICTVIASIEGEGLLQIVYLRNAQIREQCITCPAHKTQGKVLLLGLVFDRPTIEVRNALLQYDVLVGTSAGPRLLRILASFVLESVHVGHLARALESITPDSKER